MAGATPRWIVGLIALLFAAGGLGVTWWAVGPMDESAAPPESLQHVVAPPALNDAIVGGAGLVALVVAAGALLGVGRPSRTEGGVLAAAVATGVLLAVLGRVVTRGTIGANIGGGLLLLVVPLVPLAWVVGLVRLRR